MSNPNLSTLITALGPSITAASAAGNTNLLGELVGLLHFGPAPSPTAGLDFKAKTMTGTWEQANPQTAITLYAAGWTMIPG